MRPSLSRLYKTAALATVLNFAEHGNYLEAQTSPAGTTLSWNRNDTNGLGVRWSAWELDPNSFQRITPSPANIQTTLNDPNPPTVKLTSTTIELPEGSLWEVAVDAWNAQGHSGYSNSVFVNRRNEGLLRAVTGQDNSFLITRGNSTVQGSDRIDQVHVTGSTANVQADLKGGNDRVRAGDAGSINVFNLGAGDDLISFRGGTNTITGGTGRDTYQYLNPQLLSAAPAPVIQDFSITEDVFQFDKNTLRVLPATAPLTPENYLRLVKNPFDSTAFDLHVNPWYEGFGSNVAAAHIIKAALFKNTLPQMSMLDPALDSATLARALYEQRAIKFDHPQAEIFISRHDYYKSNIQVINDYNPTTSPAIVLRWAPGLFGPLENTPSNIDNTLAIIQDPGSSNDAVIIFNPFGHMNDAIEQNEEMIVLKGAWPAIVALKQPQDSSVAAAMFRTGKILAVKNMREYKIPASVYTNAASSYSIYTLSNSSALNTYDPIARGDRLIVEVPGINAVANSSNINNYFTFTPGSPTERLFGKLTPPGGASKNVLRLNDGTGPINSITQPGETPAHALYSIRSLFLVPEGYAPTPPSSATDFTMDQAAYQAGASIIAPASSASALNNIHLHLTYTPGYPRYPANFLADNFISVTQSGPDARISLNPYGTGNNANSKLAAVLTGGWAQILALQQNGETAAQALIRNRNIDIKPSTIYNYEVDAAALTANNYKIVTMGPTFDPRIDKIKITHVAGYNAAADINNFITFSAGTSNRGFLKINNVTAVRVNDGANAMPTFTLPGETVPEALVRLGCLSLEP